MERSEPGAILLALHSRDHSSLSPSITDKILALIVEVETSYRSYEEAARQACLYVLTGKIDSGSTSIDEQTPLPLRWPWVIILGVRTNCAIYRPIVKPPKRKVSRGPWINILDFHTPAPTDSRAVYCRATSFCS
ncbi:hypothetical protein RSOLAG1IB_12109 [Rhizoctonia solani AG-1 IB]|uniref:Uncharacterized protein n=1 Tax=Thanatephorus cucumeris (strain AG1-IB / isolate 7/3/14) TaxID=1108050 RepID=A0A0B7FM51_THACB|nr:hypothetical protein RSOLAG1IB_12109 [Rhizoctonia solani AG-1 IB]